MQSQAGQNNTRRRLTIGLVILGLAVGSGIFALFRAFESPGETLSVARWDLDEPSGQVYDLEREDVKTRCPLLADLFAEAEVNKRAATMDSSEIEAIREYLHDATGAQAGAYFVRYAGNVYSVGVDSP
jgi:hypothetical protein